MKGWLNPINNVIHVQLVAIIVLLSMIQTHVELVSILMDTISQLIPLQLAKYVLVL